MTQPESDRFDWRALRSAPGTIPHRHLDSMHEKLPGKKLRVRFAFGDTEHEVVCLAATKVLGEMQWFLEYVGTFDRRWYRTEEIASIVCLEPLS